MTLRYGTTWNFHSALSSLLKPRPHRQHVEATDNLLLQCSTSSIPQSTAVRSVDRSTCCFPHVTSTCCCMVRTGLKNTALSPVRVHSEPLLSASRLKTTIHSRQQLVRTSSTDWRLLTRADTSSAPPTPADDADRPFIYTTHTHTHT